MIASTLKGCGPCDSINRRFHIGGPVAQGIEQRFPVPCVGGSNPSRPALLLYPSVGPFAGLSSLRIPHIYAIMYRNSLLYPGGGLSETTSSILIFVL
jgi:hypothetical protein